MSNYLPLDQMRDRGVYRLRARNFSLGAFNAATKGFVGIRFKFDSEYLFEEYHYDTGAPFGTVTPIEFVCLLPENVEAREYYPTECKNCGALAYWDADATPPAWAEKTDTPCGNTEPLTRTYTPLQDFLKWLNTEPDFS